MMLIPQDFLSMTLWHLVLFPAAWGIVTAIPTVRRWLRGRLEP